jgi:photosynthetic reaction center cytochrome c subunit
LPNDPFATYFQGKTPIRVANNSRFPTPDHVVSTKDAEKTYGLMMHMSTGLGVNCTFCHNTDSFRSWPNSRPQRVTAYYGIRMVRDVNEGYINGLASVMPANRKGPLGDPYKVNCLTCHQGQNKPLGGVSMIGMAPALKGPVGPPAGMEPAPAVAAPAEVGAAAVPASTPVAPASTGPKKATPAH